MAKRLTILTNYDSPSSPGTHHRFLCMTGDRRGESYILESTRHTIGRSNTADIKTFDSKSSREHAELTKIKNVYIVSDLNSQNGVLVNNKKVKQKELKNGDICVIGKTVFRYDVLEISKSVKTQEKSKDTSTVEEESGNKNMRIFILLAATALAFIMFQTPEEVVVQRGPIKRVKRDNEITDGFTRLIQKKMKKEDRDLEKKLNSIFHKGLREAREGNFFRAINEFNLALILSPKNARAIAYLNRSKQDLKNHVDALFFQAAQSKNSLKYLRASQTYCAIVRLYQTKKEEKAYTDAINNVRDIEKILGMVEGEIKCIPE